MTTKIRTSFDTTPQPLLPAMTIAVECPERCSVGSFRVRELTVRDDDEVSIWTDKNAPGAVRGEQRAYSLARMREAWRLSLVEVDGKAVNVDGVPYMEMDAWNQRTVRLLIEAFEELNGVSQEELQSSRKAWILKPLRTAPATRVAAVAGGSPEDE